MILGPVSYTHLFMNVYQNTKIVSTEKAFAMMRQFFGTDFEGRKIVVGEGDTLSLGKHNLTFVLAPMVHWPEAVSYTHLDERYGDVFSNPSKEVRKFCFS